MISTFERIKEVVKKIKEVYEKLEPVLQKLKELGAAIKAVIDVLQKASEMSDEAKALKQGMPMVCEPKSRLTTLGDMNNDTLNTTAQWDIFDANVTVMKENVSLTFELCEHTNN